MTKRKSKRPTKTTKRRLQCETLEVRVVLSATNVLALSYNAMDSGRPMHGGHESAPHHPPHELGQNSGQPHAGQPHTGQPHTGQPHTGQPGAERQPLHSKHDGQHRTAGRDHHGHHHGRDGGGQDQGPSPLQSTPTLPGSPPPSSPQAATGIPGLGAIPGLQPSPVSNPIASPVAPPSVVISGEPGGQDPLASDQLFAELGSGRELANPGSSVLSVFVPLTTAPANALEALQSARSSFFSDNAFVDTTRIRSAFISNNMNDVLRSAEDDTVFVSFGQTDRVINANYDRPGRHASSYLDALALEWLTYLDEEEQPNSRLFRFLDLTEVPATDGAGSSQSDSSYWLEFDSEVERLIDREDQIDNEIGDEVIGDEVIGDQVIGDKVIDDKDAEETAIDDLEGGMIELFVSTDQVPVRPSNENAKETSTKTKITKVEMDVGLAMFQVFELESFPNSEAEPTPSDSTDLRASGDGKASKASKASDATPPSPS